MIKKASLIFILCFFFGGVAECVFPEPSLAIINVSITGPPGQGPFVHNGNILTFMGTAPPHATLISAHLVDNQNNTIRDVSKGLKITPNTGDIHGSIFVGSFRGAALVHLNMLVQDTTGNKSIKGTSNMLTIDNCPPEIQIIKPKNHTYFKTTPIIIHGTTVDNLSGIADVGISIDDDCTYHPVDSFKDGQWQYAFTPSAINTAYTIKVKSTDVCGLETVSDKLTIHYIASHPSVKTNNRTPKKITPDYSYCNENKSPDDDGICTYRVTNLKNNRFQPTDLFTLKEEMAIIVKGYGGNTITIKIIVPSTGKVIFEMANYVPVNKQKMWRWKVATPGIFQAALFIDGIKKDNVYFKIIQ